VALRPLLPRGVRTLAERTAPRGGCRRLVGGLHEPDDAHSVALSGSPARVGRAAPLSLTRIGGSAPLLTRTRRPPRRRAPRRPRDPPPCTGTRGSRRCGAGTR